ncbi:hypothetical protein [Serratia odorifera]|uniref:hypothetical protein n=1 Tax=Serratia odorifera TaxID=618 RepID=UPI001D1252FD|nr:hypothetical protein [Serratia odorifera]
MIEYPGALQVVNFAEGKSALPRLKPIMAARWAMRVAMREHMPHIDTPVAAIFRQESTDSPAGSTIIEAEKYFLLLHPSNPRGNERLQRLKALQAHYDRRRRQCRCRFGRQVGERLQRQAD